MGIKKGQNTWSKGRKLSEVTKDKLSKNNAKFWLGKKRNQETILKISKSKKGKYTGKNASNWKGGLSRRKDNRLRQSLDWRLWRKSVFERDKYTCRWCFIRGVYVEPHHIKAKSRYPELCFEINNGITLCRSCHLKTIGKEEDFEMFFTEILNTK